MTSVVGSLAAIGAPLHPRLALRTRPLTVQGPQDPDAVPEGVQVRDAAPSGELHAGHFGHAQAHDDGSDCDLRLDLEAGGTEVEVVEELATEPKYP